MTELQEGMDMKTYMGLYTAIHNFCTAQKAVGTGTFSTHNRGGGTYYSFMGAHVESGHELCRCLSEMRLFVLI